MATNLPNRAQITYNRYGAATSVSVSNVTNTTLVDQYTLLVTKVPLTDSVQPGGSATYIVRLENTGTGALYAPSVTDDLGTGAGTTAPLAYIDGSAVFYLNGTETAGTAAAGENQVVFSAPDAVLETGDNLMIVYSAVMAESQTEPVVNTAEASANTGSAQGTPIAQTASATVTPVAYASVSIFKLADQTSVVSGDTLVYTLTLMNTGTADADNVVFTDVLPSEFAVTSVSYTSSGAKSVLLPTDYTLEDGTLTIPSPAGTVSINVPAADLNGPGTAVIEVTGTVTGTV